MPPIDPRVLAELDGEQRTDGQTPPAGPDPEVVERMARLFAAPVCDEVDVCLRTEGCSCVTDAQTALATIRPGDALGNGLVAVRVDAMAAAVKAEREACADRALEVAKMLMGFAVSPRSSADDRRWYRAMAGHFESHAAAIRARVA